MGKCTYCGRDAGWFSSVHPECKRNHEELERKKLVAAEEITSMAVSAAFNPPELDTLADRVGRTASAANISQDTRPLLIAGWDRAVDQATQNGVLTYEQEANLKKFASRFSLSNDDLNKTGSVGRAAKSLVLRDLMEGRLPSRLEIKGSLPFNFLPSEHLVWYFPDARYLEERVHRDRVGGYQGASIRVARGVYYHLGGYKGHNVETTQLEFVDTGALGITTKHIYFSGTRKGFRVPYTKIVSFEPYSDGLGIHRDAASAKPQVFVTGEGWFIYNLVRNLAVSPQLTAMQGPTGSR